MKTNHPYRHLVLHNCKTNQFTPAAFYSTRSILITGKSNPVCVLAAQLGEDDIVGIFKPTLKSLSYLSFMRKIHREMKAGNIHCERKGHAKLADCSLDEHLTVSFDSTGPSTL